MAMTVPVAPAAGRIAWAVLAPAWGGGMPGGRPMSRRRRRLAGGPGSGVRACDGRSRLVAGGPAPEGRRADGQMVAVLGWGPATFRRDRTREAAGALVAASSSEVSGRGGWTGADTV